MNFLAHAYLSFDDENILVGNMISDFVKGSSKNNYSVAIQNGIMLHREIDTYTDHHPYTHLAKEIFKADYRLYSAPIVDILFDHFLANDETIFTDETLKAFSLNVYSSLQMYASVLPFNFYSVFQYMEKENWLYGYRTIDSMQRSLKGLARRATYMKESETAFDLFKSNYSSLKILFSHFFPDVKQFTKDRFRKFSV
jgi:acyl carrier protein phosphodiesterase